MAKGLVAKQLHYAVYDANDASAGAIFASDVAESPAAANSTIDFTLKLNLVKGKTYDFIFWPTPSTTSTTPSPPRKRTSKSTMPPPLATTTAATPSSRP